MLCSLQHADFFPVLEPKGQVDDSLNRQRLKLKLLHSFFPLSVFICIFLPDLRAFLLLWWRMKWWSDKSGVGVGGCKFPCLVYWESKSVAWVFLFRVVQGVCWGGESSKPAHACPHRILDGYEKIRWWSETLSFRSRTSQKLFLALSFCLRCCCLLSYQSRLICSFCSDILKVNPEMHKYSTDTLNISLSFCSFLVVAVFFLCCCDASEISLNTNSV